MPDASAKHRLAALREEVAKHDLLYHRDAKPVVSDFEYDRLKRELAELEAAHREPTIEGSPAVTVGDDRTDRFISYRHRSPMLSLDNTYNRDELFKFDARMLKLFGDTPIEYAVEPKIDGVAVSLTYENGRFIRAVTRGNGAEGDDITQNAKLIAGIPSLIAGSDVPDWIEIRGEIYMTIEEFDRINRMQASADLPLYANPRNFAAGTVKLLDSKVAAERELRIILYALGFCDPQIFRSQREFHFALKTWKFPAVEQFCTVNGIEAAWDRIMEIDELRKYFAYATDGAVVKVDNIAMQETAGATNKAPRWQIAYKFAAEQAETVLEKISIQVGRTGVLTPVAELRPVLLAGTTVSRATLHNADEIARKDIREGDAVVVEKAGEIIPAVVNVILDKRAETRVPFAFPTICPSCGAGAIRLPEEAAWRCPNLSCPRQIRRRIQHFASRQAMDIEGLGVAVIDQLVDRALVENIADLYDLTAEDLIPLDKFAQKSSGNLLAALDASKRNELWRFIHGLGIQHVGATVSKDLTESFRNLRDIMEADEATLLEIDGIGATLAGSIRRFFADAGNLGTVKRLITHGLNTQVVESDDSESPKPFTGKVFVLTGTLPSMTRDEAKALIEKAGGRVTGSVSGKTDYLLAGESSGSKFRKAEKLKVPIIDETQLLRISGDADRL